MEAFKNVKDRYFQKNDSKHQERKIFLYQENTKLRNIKVQIKRDLIEQQEANENRDLQLRLEKINISCEAQRKLTENQIIVIYNEIDEESD